MQWSKCSAIQYRGCHQCFWSEFGDFLAVFDELDISVDVVDVGDEFFTESRDADGHLDFCDSSYIFGGFLCWRVEIDRASMSLVVSSCTKRATLVLRAENTWSFAE